MMRQPGIKQALRSAGKGDSLVGRDHEQTPGGGRQSYQKQDLVSARLCAQARLPYHVLCPHY